MKHIALPMNSSIKLLPAFTVNKLLADGVVAVPCKSVESYSNSLLMCVIVICLMMVLCSKIVARRASCAVE